MIQKTYPDVVGTGDKRLIVEVVGFKVSMLKKGQVPKHGKEQPTEIENFIKLNM